MLTYYKDMTTTQATSPFGPTAAEKAATIRADIKAAAQAGELAAPAGVKFSVKAERASLMSSINVTMRGVPAEWATQQSTTECRELARKLSEIIARHHKADGRHYFAEVRLESGRAVRFATERGWLEIPR